MSSATLLQKGGGYDWLVGDYSFSDEQVIFSCPRCGQKMVIPVKENSGWYCSCSGDYYTDFYFTDAQTLNVWAKDASDVPLSGRKGHPVRN